ncbi:hypothetical protein PHAVU_011G156300 [Phaseolus vulgaris]|uniref:Uncharacterized protein n=1 Tax=Phaseolus vulgaris TaxID=3885 RepID=V7AIU8_PHAVU|nr:hypothetical protein PHAVU_011G156300g [Phaseolus vulgaris]ESW05150.1 hypothetical protein PHAVU_011G156300g [Phaseolus vulgaris]
MESPKRKSKLRMCRFFRCFNPSAVVSREPKKPVPILTYIAVPEKKVFPTVITSAFTVVKGGEGNASHHKKTDTDNNNSNTNSDNSLRRALVAALNHTSLAKKLNRKRKAKRDGFPRESSTNSSSKFSSYSSGSLGFTTTSMSSSTSTTLSTSSTMSSSSPCEPFLTRSLAMNNGDGRRWFCGSNIALSVFFITILLVLILCGRCYAIPYAAIGFYVVPNRRRTIEEN